MQSIMQNTCYMQYRVTTTICTGCGTCMDVCPTEAIKLEDGHAVITIECVDCGSCTRVCPEGAIKKLTVTVAAPNS